MKTEVREFLESEVLSECEVIELVRTYRKLVNLGVLSDNGFEDVLNRLGVKQISENTFQLDEESEYVLS